MAEFDSIAFLIEFCSIPTAPFVEHRVQAHVDALVAQNPSLRLKRDRFGNRLVVRPGTSRRRSPRLIFVAHLDHPGFVACEMLDDRTLRADFRGGVLASFVDGSRVRLFDGGRQTIGRVTSVEADAGGYAIAATIRVREPIVAGSIGMFDVGEARIRGKRLHSRACDDLAGAAATLALLVGLADAPAACDVGVLLTRGEEYGFVGAIAAAQDGGLLRPTDRMISIETSAEQPVAKQGEGVVLRVGDRTSIFHSAFSRFIFDTASALAAESKSFKFQRALMPGGTCEGTVFDAFGYTAAAICIPLGNYHNMDRAKNRIAAEHVHLDDWRNMLALFIAIARSAHTFDGSHAAIRERLLARFEANRALLG